MSFASPLEAFESHEPQSSERGACGIGAVVDRERRANNTVVQLALEGLCDADLRGARIDSTGDGAGLMFRTTGLRPFLEHFIPPGTRVPEREEIHIGNFFMEPGEGPNLERNLRDTERILARHGIHSVGWRLSTDGSLPVNDAVLGARARETMPIIAQLLFTHGFRPEEALPGVLHEAKLELPKKLKETHVVSLERGTATFKAMSTGAQLRQFYSDFSHPDFKSDAALWHVRFATNVLSRWKLAQPFRLIGHNGEINTAAAMRDATRNMEKSLRIQHSVLMHQGSDSGDLDRTVELFHAHGVPLSETLRRIFQPTPDDRRRMPQNVQRYHAAARRAMGAISAAEGPAGIVAMDRDEVVGCLDGLGLRPLRLIETTDGLVVMTSEIGAPEIPLNKIKRTFQLDAGEIVIIQKDGTVLYPGEADQHVVRKTQLNYEELGNGTVIHLPATRAHVETLPRPEVIAKWNKFGGNAHLLDRVSSMAREGKEPVIGMGNDQPLAVFSKGNPRLASYFHEIVAVVTNPPMDPIREGDSMDLATYLGRRPIAREHAHEYKPQPHIELASPILTEEEYQNLIDSEGEGEHLPVFRFDTAVRENTVEGMLNAIDDIKSTARKIVRKKEFSVIVLSDRSAREGEAYIPPALIAAALRNELSHRGLRRHASIVCDTGEAFEAHDIALLIAMGANAVNPYLMWQAADAGVLKGEGRDAETLKKNLVGTFTATLRRIMSKMGITSVEGYRGSKLMEAVGIDPTLMQFFFESPVANIGGVTLADIMSDIQKRGQAKDKVLPVADDGAYNKTVRDLLEAIYYKKPADPKAAFEAFVSIVREQAPVYLRDLLELNRPESSAQVPLEEVVSMEDLFAHHIRGTAMSHGALQLIAHRAIAGAFNELGGMANSGEGGELPERNRGGALEGDRSKIRQVASARFAVNAEYLVNADELEIKIGQGAKPGEGGHLPGFKVGPIIARMRNTQVGIDLISPPPQHDIYSIEDLTRLIQDLRAVNPLARIAVKITSNTDIGTVAVGVAKAGADVIGLSGWEGGTGAAVSSAIEHTGLPLEKGLAEVHQALVRNTLRDSVKIRADGGIKTPDDAIKLACLGADEIGLGTVLLVAAERCIFCHSCSGNAKGVQPGTFSECPTGIMPITQIGTRKLGLGARKAAAAELMDDERSYETCKSAAKHFLTLFSEGIRERLAQLGKHSWDEIVGDTTLLNQIQRSPEADRVRLDSLMRDVRKDRVTARAAKTANEVSLTLHRQQVNEANLALVERAAGGEREIIVNPQRPSDRSFGATLAGKIATKEIRPPEGGFRIKTEGCAGQSYGFAAVSGMHLEHTGFANDFVGMAQSGGEIVVRQLASGYHRKNSVAGNACGYGATGGKLFVGGKVGQRFGVRNSGAMLVAEYTGKYAFEYMTRGTGIVLRKPGYQTGAGMTGGKLYVRDRRGDLGERLHKDVIMAPWTKRDRAELKGIVAEFAEKTGSQTAARILEKGDSSDGFESFARVVPKDHFVNAVNAVLSYDFFRLDDAAPFESVVEGAATELCVLVGLDEDNLEVRRAVGDKLIRCKADFEQTVQAKIAADPKTDIKEAPYRFQFAKGIAQKWLEKLPDELRAELAFPRPVASQVPHVA